MRSRHRFGSSHICVCVCGGKGAGRAPPRLSPLPPPPRPNHVAAAATRPPRQPAPSHTPPRISLCTASPRCGIAARCVLQCPTPHVGTGRLGLPTSVVGRTIRHSFCAPATTPPIALSRARAPICTRHHLLHHPTTGCKLCWIRRHECKEPEQCQRKFFLTALDVGLHRVLALGHHFDRAPPDRELLNTNQSPRSVPARNHVA